MAEESLVGFARLAEQRRQIEQQLKSSDAGGTSGGMEARIAKLEAHMEHVRDDLAKLQGIPVDVATLKSDVSHLPTKGWMVGALGTSLAIIAALIAFAEKIHAVVH